MTSEVNPLAVGGITAVIFFTLVSLVWGLWHLYRWQIMPNPSPHTVLVAAHELLQSAGIDPKRQRLIDCGCGLALSLKVYQELGWRCLIGIEGSYVVATLARGLAKLNGIGSQKIFCADWKAKWLPDAHEGDVLFFYTCPSMMKEAKAFLSEQRNLPSFWLLTHTFALPGMTPERTIFVEGLYRTPIYLYQFKRPAI